MSLGQATTILESLSALPQGQARGYTFRAADGSERFFAFEDVKRLAEARAARLQALGLAKGDRVALVIADPAEFVLTFLGAVCGGMVPVPIYPRASFKAKNSYAETIRHVVASAESQALITTDATAEILVEAGVDTQVSHFVTLEKLLAGEPGNYEQPEITPADLCFLQFTSGSTAMPKGVMVTHANLIANARDFLGPHGLDRRPDDVGLTWLPLYHDMGLIGFVLATLICDIPVYFIPTESFARRPGMWLELATERKATILFAPNFAYALATKRVRDKDLASLDLSRVRIAGCGAEPINPGVMRAFAQRFESVGFSAQALMPCYGMAEATLAVTFTPHGSGVRTDLVETEALRAGQATPAINQEPTTEVVSCGIPFPSTQVTVVDDQGTRLGERQVGELVVEGPGVAAGYYRNPELTAASFPEGRLRTGDLGYMAEGHVYVCGRAKDLIIIRGANIHPQDIEWTVAEVEGVRRDNVVAFSVMQDGEEQLVIAAEGNWSNAATLRQQIARRVAEVHSLKVAHVAIVKLGSLPKTSSGKVQRRRTRALYETRSLEDAPE